MPAAPGSFLVGPSFLGVVETTKEIITHVLASCKHEFQQPKRWMKSRVNNSFSAIAKMLMIPGFYAEFRLAGSIGNIKNSPKVFYTFFAVGSSSCPRFPTVNETETLPRRRAGVGGMENLLQQHPSATLERYGFLADKLGSLAQLVRALASHARGRWFESSKNHHKRKAPLRQGRGAFLMCR